MDKPLAFQNLDLLRAIQAEPGQTITALSERLSRDQSNTTKTIKRLEAFIDRDTMALTDAGLAILAADDVAEGRATAPAGAAPGAVFDVTHGQIRPNPDNDRRDWDSAEAVADLDSLADTIVAKGVLQNLSVRATPDGEAEEPWTLVGGERRWRAIGRAIDDGRLPSDYPITVRVGDYADDGEQREVALIENAQRRDLNPIEEALAFKALKDRDRTTAQIAALAKVTDRQVQMRLQLLELSEADQHRMTLPEDDPKFLSVSKARAIIQEANLRAKRISDFETANTPRQRLIMAEVRSAQTAAGGSHWTRLPADPVAMEADPDALALAEAGFVRCTANDLEGTAAISLEWSGSEILDIVSAKDPDAYAARLRQELGLPEPAEDACSIEWLNGPFELSDEAKARIAERKAEQEAQEREQQAKREADDAERLAAKQAVTARDEGFLGAVRSMTDSLRSARPPALSLNIADMAAEADCPLPWSIRFEPDRAGNLEPNLVDANGRHVRAGGAGLEARRLMIAAGVNALAGLPTPEQAPPDPDAVPSDDLDREAFIAAIGEHMAALPDADREELGEVTAEGILDAYLDHVGIAFGDPGYGWTRADALAVLGEFDSAESDQYGDEDSDSEPGSGSALPCGSDDQDDEDLSPALKRLAGVKDAEPVDAE